MGNRSHLSVIPWNKDIENVLHRLKKDRIAYTVNIKLAKEFGMKHPFLIREEFLDITTTNYRRKKKKTIFALSPNTQIVQNNKKFSFHKIF